MSDTTDYLKYVAERSAAYLNLPADERRERRKKKREPWQVRWFGQLLPLGIRIWWTGRKKEEEPAARF
ncbi:YqzE family protein [Cohnella rhizosphaerae]|uniref:YqzE family protein n=1 Tax=Cohnella rhizosphaerae TaxID=1457232 RepID=A0A9X4KY66_9BACL|nr:YqzE family protein [Cohnella rhizosphaerae]MDG0813360.1 YqzE family protein [Cohnella rhizosphaerae]